jgi:hypothetical protein
MWSLTVREELRHRELGLRTGCPRNIQMQDAGSDRGMEEVV